LTRCSPPRRAASTLLFTLSDTGLLLYLGAFAGFLLYIGASDICRRPTPTTRPG
jgi:hypothetical protein